MLDHRVEEVLPDLLTELLDQPLLAPLEGGRDEGQDGVHTLLLDGHHLSALHTLLQEQQIILQEQ